MDKMFLMFLLTNSVNSAILITKVSISLLLDMKLQKLYYELQKEGVYHVRFQN